MSFVCVYVYLLTRDLLVKSEGLITIDLYEGVFVGPSFRAFVGNLFVDASSHLYNRVCPSIGPSVRPSVTLCPKQDNQYL